MNNPNDAGGATNKGITTNVYNRYRKSKNLAPQDVRLLTEGELSEIYRHLYWDSFHCGELPGKLAVAHMDTAVNGGALSVLNRTLGLRTSLPFGAKTLARLATVTDVPKTVEKYLDFRNSRYDDLATVHPTDSPKQRSQHTKNQTFIKGWHNRVRDLRQYIATIP